MSVFHKKTLGLPISMRHEENVKRVVGAVIKIIGELSKVTLTGRVRLIKDSVVYHWDVELQQNVLIRKTNVRYYEGIERNVSLVNIAIVDITRDPF